MKMGIKEFRERLGEIARGDRPIEVTDRGRTVGTYRPRRQANHEAAHEAVRDIADWQAEMRVRGVDLDGILADLGMDPDGNPLPGQA